MAEYAVHGPIVIDGCIRISGAKNAALPVLAACLMVNGEVKLKEIPSLTDVTHMLQLITELGVKMCLNEDGTIELDAANVHHYGVSHDLMKAIRASILVMGPLLSRFGQARISVPGGCAIGLRPVDQHLSALEQMGAKIDECRDGYMVIEAPDGLKGADIIFDTVTVTGTENIMMAAVLAKGETRIYNAAREPEVVDLANFLNDLGAKITGMGTDTLTVRGVKELHGGSYKVIPDRIEAGTYLIGAAMTRGRIRLENVIPMHNQALFKKLQLAGAEIAVGDDWVELDMQGNQPKSVDVTTCAYPGFPTDLQAQWMALASVSEGTCTIRETLFENRLMHAQEYKRMGANLEQIDRSVIVHGQQSLQGAPVEATDLRASAGLLLAAFVAEGTTTIKQMEFIDRGYEHVYEKLGRVGLTLHEVPS